MARWDVKSGRESSEFRLSIWGLRIGSATMGIEAALSVVGGLYIVDRWWAAVAAGCVLVASGGMIAAVALASYQGGRSKVKAAAHAPQSIVVGDRGM